MSFSSIPIRANGQNIDFAWFNELRTAGVLLEGSGSAIFDIPNTAANVDVTGLIIDKTVLNVVFIKYTIRRDSNSDAGRRTYGDLIAYFENDTGVWGIDHKSGGGAGNNALSGVTFTIDASTGQVKLSSDTMSAAGYLGKFSWVVTNSFILEP